MISLCATASLTYELPNKSSLTGDADVATMHDDFEVVKRDSHSMSETSFGGA